MRCWKPASEFCRRRARGVDGCAGLEPPVPLLSRGRASGPGYAPATPTVAGAFEKAITASAKRQRKAAAKIAWALEALPHGPAARRTARAPRSRHRCGSGQVRAERGGTGAGSGLAAARGLGGGTGRGCTAALPGDCGCPHAPGLPAGMSYRIERWRPGQYRRRHPGRGNGAAPCEPLSPHRRPARFAISELYDQQIAARLATSSSAKTAPADGSSGCLPHVGSTRG